MKVLNMKNDDLSNIETSSDGENYFFIIRFLELAEKLKEKHGYSFNESSDLMFAIIEEYFRRNGDQY